MTDSLVKPGQAGTNQNNLAEITPEMIEAGAEEISVWYAEPYPMDRFRDLAEKVFRAMTNA